MALLLKGELIRGAQPEEFERLFKEYLGVKHAICVSSARMGLYLILKTWGIGAGDEVIVPSLTCPIVPGVVTAVGAVPIFADSDPETFNMSFSEIEKKIGPRTKAIVATHIEGMPCEIERICALATSHGIKVIEDCAQALGALYHGKKTGTFGDAAFFSFAYGKQINTMGGGMLVICDDVYAGHIRKEVENYAYPSYGSILQRCILQLGVDLGLSKFVFALLIFPIIALSNFLRKDIIDLFFGDSCKIEKLPSYGKRYTNYQAWMGIRQMKEFSQKNEQRNANASLYSLLLSGNIGRQKKGENMQSASCYYSIYHKEREKIRKKLFRYGVDTQSSWNRSCAGLPVFQSNPGECPVAERLSKEIIYLPVYPRLNENDIRYIAAVINKTLT